MPCLARLPLEGLVQFLVCTPITSGQAQDCFIQLETGLTVPACALLLLSSWSSEAYNSFMQLLGAPLAAETALPANRSQQDRRPRLDNP